MPRLILDGDSKGAVRATQELTEAQKEHGKEVKKTEALYDAWSARLQDSFKKAQREIAAAKRESEELGRVAARIIQDNETPQDRYNRKVAELSRLFVAGKLNVEQMDQALARYRHELNQVAPAQDQAFGDRAGQQMTSFLLRYVGPGALLAGATAALQRYHQELQGIAATLQGDRSGLGELAQLAATSSDPQGKMASLVDEAKKISSMGAGTSLGEAGHLVFALESANITDPKHRELVAKALSYGTLRDANNFASSIAAVRSAFPDLTPGQTLGMGIVAGTISPGDASQVVAATGKSAQQLKALGYSPAFGLAAESILSRDYGGAQEGGARLEQMLKHLEHEGFATDPTLKGMDPIAMLRKIGAGGLGQENLRKYAGGRMEALQGFRSLIGNVDLLDQLTKQAAGGDEGLVNNMIDLAKQTPEIDASRQAIAAQNTRNIRRIPSVTPRQLIQSAYDEMAGDAGAFRSGILGLTAWAHMNLDTEMQQRAELRSLLENQGTNHISADLAASIRRYLESIDNKTRDAPLRPGVQER